MCVLVGPALTTGYCRLANARINLVSGEPACLESHDETTGNHSLSLGRGSRYIFAAFLLRPLHDASPGEILHTLSVRDWRDSLAHADHAGIFRHAVGAPWAAALTFVPRVTNPGSARRSACRN